MNGTTTDVFNATATVTRSFDYRSSFQHRLAVLDKQSKIESYGNSSFMGRKANMKKLSYVHAFQVHMEWNPNQFSIHLGKGLNPEDKLDLSSSPLGAEFKLYAADNAVLHKATTVPNVRIVK
jgi:hypothetical protein